MSRRKREAEKKREEKKEEKNKLSTESNLGPLTLRGKSCYAYNSEGVMDYYSIRAWGEHWTESMYFLLQTMLFYQKNAC